MDSSSATYMEVTFNILYLLVIYFLVILMYRKLDGVAASNRGVAGRFFAAFLLLAVGDTGHVGFRVIAIASGGLEAHPVLVGLGALATAITVTGFYMLMVDLWRIRFNVRRNGMYWFLLSMGVVRLVFMALPGNEWGSIVPPVGFSYIRNGFLTILGLGIAILLLVDGLKQDDRMSKKLAYAMFASYLFYIPVILFVQRVPLLGMLMIPKTIAYLVMAVIGYRSVFLVPNENSVST